VVVRDRSRRYPPGFGIIWTTVAIDLVGFGIVFPILPLYAEDFGASPAVVGALVASYSLAQVVFAPLWGRLSDRIGRKPALIASLVGTAVGSLMTGLAGSLWVLFAGRVVDGISGASVSVAQAAVADVAPPDERPRLLGLLGAAFGLGFVVGPALGGLAALGGPELPFLLAAAIAGVNALVAIRRLPDTGPPAAEPAPPAPARPDRVLLRLGMVMFVGMVAFSGFEATFALLGERRVGLDLASAGAVFAAIGLALVLVQTSVVGPVSDRWGALGTVRAGLVANAAGLALLAVDDGWTTLVPSLALLVLGQGLLVPTLAAAVSDATPAGRRGTALGYQQSAGHLARVAGPLAAGALFEHVGPASPYLLGAVLVLGAAALVPTPRGSGASLLPSGNLGP
jgi:multidrug resistance protein